MGSNVSGAVIQLANEQRRPYGIIESMFYHPISWIALISIPANAEYVARTLVDCFIEMCLWIMSEPIALACVIIGIVLFIAELIWELRPL